MSVEALLSINGKLNICYTRADFFVFIPSVCNPSRIVVERRSALLPVYFAKGIQLNVLVSSRRQKPKHAQLQKYAVIKYAGSPTKTKSLPWHAHKYSLHKIPIIAQNGKSVGDLLTSSLISSIIIL